MAHYSALSGAQSHPDASAAGASKFASDGIDGIDGGGGGRGDALLNVGPGGGATGSEERSVRNARSYEDDANWRGLRCCGGYETCGFVYYGYGDDRLCVPRRYVRCWAACRCCESRGCARLGLIGAVNVGHRWGWPLLALIVLVFLGGEGVSWAVEFFKAKV
jgi:hypothetical protein